MRIVQTSDGRYIKILSPQLEGLIDRMYQEIRDRKASDVTQNDAIETQQNQIVLISSQMETMLIRYAEMTDILRRMFPEDEPTAIIEKPLIVEGAVKGLSFISTETTAPPLEVNSLARVDNLNVEYISDNSLDDLHNTMDDKVEVLNVDVTDRFTRVAPITHIGQAGTGAHPDATQSVSGFMSVTDKIQHDQMKAKLDTFNVPGGMDVGSVEPSSPTLMQVWIDTN